ncbi:MAG: DUF6514 family protein [Oscillospiraceae bacterium]|nr:DUF6514 family protein [Oscillospiraceae bacterium]
MAVVQAELNGYCGINLVCELTTAPYIDEDDDLGYTTPTYGIKVINDEGKVVFKQDDISTDKFFVEDFIRLCETKFVPLIHIRDVLDDYMC